MHIIFLPFPSFMLYPTHFFPYSVLGFPSVRPLAILYPTPFSHLGYLGLPLDCLCISLGRCLSASCICASYIYNYSHTYDLSRPYSTIDELEFLNFSKLCHETDSPVRIPLCVGIKCFEFTNKIT